MDGQQKAQHHQSILLIKEEKKYACMCFQSEWFILQSEWFFLGCIPTSSGTVLHL